MSLKAQLDARRCAFETNAEPDVVVALRRSIQTLAERGLIAKAVKAGEMAPLFRLQRGHGGFTDLSDLLKRGPAVISFFPGNQCPFCTLELAAPAEAHAEIERLGATLIALSPQARGKSPSPGRDSEPPFPILQDPGCEIAARYRIAFTIAQQFRAAYRALGYPNSTKTRSKAWVLPIPATYVLDSTGLIVLSYLDADFMTRLEPAEIIAALTHLRGVPAMNSRADTGAGLGQQQLVRGPQPAQLTERVSGAAPGYHSTPALQGYPVGSKSYVQCGEKTETTVSHL